MHDTNELSTSDEYVTQKIQVIKALRHFEFKVFGASKETTSYFTRRQLKSSACDTEILSIEAKQFIFGIPSADRLDSENLINFFRREGVEIVPVYWGTQEHKFSDIMSIRMNEGGNHFLLLNMNALATNYDYMLALGFGHYIAIECMQPSELDEFSEDLARYLLTAYNAPSQGSEISNGNEQANGNLSQSLVEMLCGMKTPDANTIKNMARMHFGTRFFDAISSIQWHSEPSPNNTASTMANKIASALCMDAADAMLYSVEPGFTII
ncbi:hypothetical protein ACFQNJ_01255 [Hydrogenophaga bisanensis]|uniref:Uncharacterized protein n=1 Tax=Hydrogenophaga bisanensis TaxID=439611 RepID=A0ABW2R425_9BURK